MDSSFCVGRAADWRVALHDHGDQSFCKTKQVRRGAVNSFVDFSAVNVIVHGIFFHGYRIKLIDKLI